MVHVFPGEVVKYYFISIEKAAGMVSKACVRSDCMWKQLKEHRGPALGGHVTMKGQSLHCIQNSHASFYKLFKVAFKIYAIS